MLVTGCATSGKSGGAAGAPPAGVGGSSGTGGGGSGGVAGAGIAGNAGGTGGGGAGNAAGGTGGSAIAGSGGAAAGGRGGAGGSAGAGGAAETYPVPNPIPADEDGSLLWLRYKKVPLPGRLAEYQAALNHVVKAGSSATLQAAQSELVTGLGGLLGVTVPVADQPTGNGAVVLGTPSSSTIIANLALFSRLPSVGPEGYLIETADVGGKAAIVVAGNTDAGVLRGAFALLRHLQCHRPVAGLALSGTPRIRRRLLNHWDNMDGTVERGYAGRSLWSWSSLPATISQRYKDYARANASLGINGTVLNNVNSNAQILTAANLDKVAALATAFRPYGIAVYLSARFSAPS